MDIYETRRLFFIKEGLSPEDALDLVEKLRDRDEYEFDDRKLCFECANYLKNGTCLKRLRKGIPQSCLRFVLQRCEDYKEKT
jgi:hypothetical protein